MRVVEKRKSFLTLILKNNCAIFESAVMVYAQPTQVSS